MTSSSLKDNQFLDIKHTMHVSGWFNLGFDDVIEVNMTFFAENLAFQINIDIGTLNLK